MKKGSNKKHTLSLYRQFEPGDRVKRKLQGGKGESHEMEGIIMSMDHDRLEVYWDTIDGIYSPTAVKEEFTVCDYEEVMYGTKIYSPVKHKKSVVI
jgi:hypothetical protein